MTVTGKIQKFKMREVAIELLGLQEAASASSPRHAARSGRQRPGR